MPADRGRRLSKHFTLGDFLVDSPFPELAVMLDPDDQSLTNLDRLAQLLDRIVEKFPPSWVVLSGFRDRRLNDACRQAGLPASVNSLHLNGCAADIQSKDFELDPEITFEWLREQARELAVHEA